MNQRALGILSVLIVAASASHFGARAQDITNFAGIWNNIMFSTPSRLTLIRNTNQVVTQILNAEQFDVGTAQIQVNADGTFSGPVSGTISLADAGTVLVNVSGAGTVNFHVNLSGDFMYSMKSMDGLANDIEVLLKAPASVTPPEMAGTWRFASLATPACLNVTYTNNNQVSDVTGGDEFEAGSGTIAVNADGTVLIADEMMVTGTYALGANGAVQITIPTGPSEPPLVLTFYVNAGKNVMAGIVADAERNELLVLVKPPAASTISDFKGLWNLGIFDVPTVLTIATNWQGLVTEILNRNGFQFSNNQMAFGHWGNFTVPSLYMFGTATLSAPGSLSMQSVEGNEIRNRTVWLNSTRDTFISLGTDEDYELVLGARTPPLSSPAAGFGLMAVRLTNSLDIYWAADTNRFLQSTTNLVSWSTLTNAPERTGRWTNTYTGKGFYRLLEQR